MTDGEVCIVTQPERTGTGKSHVKDLADIIAELTSVVILTANLGQESPLREAHAVEVYSKQGTGSILPVEVVRFILNQLRLSRAIYRRPEDIVLFFGTTSYVLPVLVARLRGKRVAILPRGDVPLSLKLRWQRVMPTFLAGLLAGLVGLLERINYRLAHAIISYTPGMARELGLERYQSKLHPTGARYVDTNQFSITTPFDEREHIVGYVGRFDVEKRLDIIANAIADLPDDTRFLFVGDGDYREEIETLLSEEIDQGKVSIHGWVERDNLPELYNQFKLLVLPSHPTEGLPTVLLEGMACGTPAYATPVSGTKDVIKDGVNGFLMTEQSAHAIAARIEDILDDPELRSCSDRAYETIVEHYEFKAAVTRYRAILADLESI